MALHPEITELTTAATDVAIGILSVVCIAVLQRYRIGSPRRVAIWTWVFGLLTVAAGLGAVAHGLDITDTARAWLWRPLFLSLGLVVALFVVGAVHDFLGAAAGKAVLLPMLGLGIAFFAVTEVVSGSFLVFVLYEAIAMVAALGMYAALAWGKRLAGAGIVTVGIVVNIVAAAIQATGSVSLTIVVPFDHNGVFHLVQLIALIAMTTGLVRGMTDAPPRPDPGTARSGGGRG